MAAMQQHMYTCIKTGWELKVMVQRLTDDQLLALKNPHLMTRQVTIATCAANITRLLKNCSSTSSCTRP
jgi:hypothetical protein